jgi:hypothetical protein
MPGYKGILAGSDMQSNALSVKEPSSSGISSSPSIAPPVTSLESLSNLIEKRTSSWLYIQQAHSSSSDPWFQTAQVSRPQIDRYLAETLGSVKSMQKTRNLFVLGMSMGPILDTETPIDWCRSLSRLLDEWEVWNEVGLSGRNTGMGNGVVSSLLVYTSQITDENSSRKICSGINGWQESRCLLSTLHTIIRTTPPDHRLNTDQALVHPRPR